MDEDMLLMICKAGVFAIVCILLGMLLAHWIIWG
jgi:hypothetical protein